ncbi:MAG: chromosomal replication initiator protein DnaA [Rhodobacteraceae bacterium]|nr:chromosomal replication initiator protein DnaA [Paracoccaceae bacterium]
MQVQAIARSDPWDRVKKSLTAELGEDAFSNWFGGVIVEEKTNGTVRLSVPTRFLKHWIQSNYQKSLTSFWKEEDRSIRHVEVTVRSATRPRNVITPKALTRSLAGANGAAMPCSTSNRHGLPHTAHSGQHSSADADAMPHAKQQHTGTDSLSEVLRGAPLSPKFSMDNFVPGAPNQRAQTVAKQFAQGVVTGTGLMYLHAGVGHGKTHLLQAIARTAQAEGQRVCYLTAEHFMYQLVPALQSNSSAALRHALESIDLMLIDDLQFLHGKQARTEFSATLLALITPVQRIVLASDRPPHSLETVETPLRELLNQGTVISIQPLDFQLRRKILETRLKTAQASLPTFDIPADVMTYIASRISSCGRDLEGAINRLVAHHQLTSQAITRFLADKILSDLISARENRTIKIDDIQNVVCKHFNLSKTDLLSACRARNLSLPRQIAMYLAKSMTPRSLPEIGKKFGGRDHTTVLHAVRKIEAQSQEDKALNKELTLLKRIILG